MRQTIFYCQCSLKLRKVWGEIYLQYETQNSDIKIGFLINSIENKSYN